MRRNLLGIAVSLALCALAAGCSSSKPGPAPDGCPAGELGCLCTTGGTCDALLTCEAGTCASCSAGKVGCACLGNGTCLGGAACRGGLCAACQDGAEGCACLGGTTCQGALACREGYCVDLAGCPEGTLDCACRVGGGCDTGLACQAGSCRTCSSDVAGCPCSGGACQGLVCGAADLCRPAATCAACATHQRCTPGTTTQDAACLAACDPGFDWNAMAGACDADPQATCALGTAGSIATACTAENRPCVTDGAGAHCGTCRDGYLEEGRSCRPVLTCDALACTASHRSCTPPGPHADAACGGCAPGFVDQGGACVPDAAASCATILPQCTALHMLCQEGAAGPSCQGCAPGYLADPALAACRLPYTCSTLPGGCPAGYACDPGDGSGDATCRLNCPPCDRPDLGEDGPFPQLTLKGTCICKSRPGYFYTDAGATGIYPCDKDGDGWTRDSARFSLGHADPVIRENARCSLRSVDRIVLHNELGQQEPLAALLPGGKLLPLYETQRNDDDDELRSWSAPADVPPYGQGGRLLVAAEINGFTKACAGSQADFNHNGVVDVAEWGSPQRGGVGGDSQSTPAKVPGDLLEAFLLYTRFSYFLETHRGWFEAGASAQTGTYHIGEKSRLLTPGDNFPLRYGVEQVSGQRTSDYWQTCERARDLWYVTTSPPVGMDFASLSGPDRDWRGMLHHSQFKCVQVVSQPVYDALTPDGRAASRHLQTRATIGPRPEPAPIGTPARRDYLNATPNRCAAAAGSRPTSGAALANPQEPIITCLPVSTQVLADGEVGWATVHINTDAATYDRGCLFQCAGFPRICPGADPADPDPKPCYYMCADMTASEAGVLGLGGEYQLRAEVPVAPVTDDTLTGGTFTIRPEVAP